jgi:hypothetical protein
MSLTRGQTDSGDHPASSQISKSFKLNYPIDGGIRRVESPRNDMIPEDFGENMIPEDFGEDSTVHNTDGEDQN